MVCGFKIWISFETKKNSDAGELIEQIWTRNHVNKDTNSKHSDYQALSLIGLLSWLFLPFLDVH